MARKKEFLTTFEWEVMNVIWDMGGQVTVKNVMDTKYPDGEKAYTSVQTVMEILVEKGFLKKEKFGPINVYKPGKKREYAALKETKIFIDKVFGGSFQKMASFLVENSGISDKEYKYLKKIIKEKGKKSQEKKNIDRMDK